MKIYSHLLDFLFYIYHYHQLKKKNIRTKSEVAFDPDVFYILPMGHLNGMDPGGECLIISIIGIV